MHILVAQEGENTSTCTLIIVWRKQQKIKQDLHLHKKTSISDDVYTTSTSRLMCWVFRFTRIHRQDEAGKVLHTET